MKLGCRDRLMQPRYLLEKVAVETQEIAASTPEKSPLRSRFAFPAELGAPIGSDQGRFARLVIAKNVLPATAALRYSRAIRMRQRAESILNLGAAE